MVLPASLAPAFPLRNCPFWVQFIFLASRKLPPDFRMSDIAPVLKSSLKGEYNWQQVMYHPVLNSSVVRSAMIGRG